MYPSQYNKFPIQRRYLALQGEVLHSAKILNESVRKHREVICYLCAQAAEKYLKGYLTYNNVIPQKTHNLVLLSDKCIEIDNSFDAIKIECGFLNRYVNEIRYPYRIEVYEEDVIYVIKSVEKIRSLDILKKIREETIKETGEKPNRT